MAQERSETELMSIEAIIRKSAPDLLEVLHELRAGRIDAGGRQRLRQALLDEFLRHGLDEGDEPNWYGIKIEGLIDFVGISNT